MAKLFQCCFVNVKAINKLNFHFQRNIKVETTLIHWRWINVILSMLFQRCFINVETTSINIRWLNFHFQPTFNVETTLFYRHWIDVILSTLFQHCFANVETTSINDVDSTFIFNQISALKQCWWTLTIKIFSTLTLVDVFAGNVLKMIMQHTKTIAKIYLDIQTALMGNFLNSQLD